MCVLLLALKQHPNYPLIAAANRDEFYHRPTSPAAFWADAPNVLAGRDLQQGGTWLGITRDARFAALTNFRSEGPNNADAPSRGHLIGDFLVGNDTPQRYVDRLAERADEYNGFSLVVGQGESWYFYSNRENEVRALGPGVYGLSNYLLDTPWPKVIQGKEAVKRLLSDNGSLLAQDLFAILADRAVADDSALPNTGVSLEHERLFSSLFVVSTEYGTRSSTVVLVGNERISFEERTYERGSQAYSRVTHSFPLSLH
ncbi:MAG: NRDE family protein [Acidiferrobacterales bacterium]